MTLRARNRWRVGLTIAMAIVLVIGAVSCLGKGLFVSHASRAGMVYAGSITRGALHLARQDRGGMERLPDPGWAMKMEPTFGPPRVEWLPVRNESLPGFLRVNWSVRVPLWIPLVLLGAPCAWAWWRHLKRPAHACAACGYDLTGLKSGICPECGQTTSA